MILQTSACFQSFEPKFHYLYLFIINTVIKTNVIMYNLSKIIKFFLPLHYPLQMFPPSRRCSRHFLHFPHLPKVGDNLQPVQTVFVNVSQWGRLQRGIVTVRAHQSNSQGGGDRYPMMKYIFSFWKMKRTVKRQKNTHNDPKISDSAGPVIPLYMNKLQCHCSQVTVYW